MAGRSLNGDELLTPAEVASLFRVDPKTVTRWAKAGKLTSIRTLGGHRRFRAEEVYSLLHRTTGTRPAEAPPQPSPTSPQQGAPRQQAKPAAPPRTINLAATRNPASRTR